MALPLKSTDVFVVGGGPSGLAAAIAARQRGFNVVVADCVRGPIDKACGEGLMPDGLDALSELGITLDECETGSFRGIKFVGREGSVQADFPRGRGIGIRCVLLHRALHEHAEKIGVSTWWGVRVSGIRDGAVVVNGESVRCRWIIGADGQNSQTRECAKLAGCVSFDRRIGMRQHFKVNPWSDFVEIHWADQGQAYVTPISANEICVALISKRRFQSFDSGLAHFPELLQRLKAAPQTSTAKGAVTIHRRLRFVARGGVALIGSFRISRRHHRRGTCYGISTSNRSGFCSHSGRPFGLSSGASQDRKASCVHGECDVTDGQELVVEVACAQGL